MTTAFHDLEMQNMQDINEEIFLLKDQLQKLAFICQEKDKQIESFQNQPKIVALDKSPVHFKLQQENVLLKKDLQEIQQHQKQLERVIYFLRERVEEFQAETRQIREEYLINQDSLLHFTLKDQEAELQIKELQGLLLNQEDMKVEYENLKILCEEKENNFKIAQQHLAKKIKDVNIQTEKNEEQKNQIQDLERFLEEQQTRVSLLQESLQNRLEQEKFTQETIKETEHQIRKWEEKYFQLHDKWQAALLSQRDYMILEEKYKQIQSLVHGLVNVVDPITQSNPIPSNNYQKIEAHQEVHSHLRYAQAFFE